MLLEEKKLKKRCISICKKKRLFWGLLRRRLGSSGVKPRRTLEAHSLVSIVLLTLGQGLRGIPKLARFDES